MHIPSRVAVLAVVLSATSAAAGVKASDLERTITVSSKDDAGTEVPSINLALRFPTVVAFEMPIKGFTVTGADGRLQTQQLEDGALILYPRRFLPEQYQPTLTVTAEDGVRFSFKLVMDFEQVDTRVVVQRRDCFFQAAGPSLAHVVLTEWKAKEKITFHSDFKEQSAHGLLIRYRGALRFGKLTVLTAQAVPRTTRSAWVLNYAIVRDSTGMALKLHTANMDESGHIAVVIDKPEGPSKGPYTLELFEEGTRNFIIAGIEL